MKQPPHVPGGAGPVRGGANDEGVFVMEKSNRGLELYRVTRSSAEKTLHGSFDIATCGYEGAQARSPIAEAHVSELL